VSALLSIWVEGSAFERKEPNSGGHHLGPVGGRLVAEVLVGLAYYDYHSFLWQPPGWQPHPAVARKEDGAFAMARLVEFTAPIY